MSEELKSGTKRKPSGYQWVRRSTCFQTSEVDREQNFTSLSRNLSKVAPHHALAPILNVQTSHFVKVLFVISLSQSRDGVSGFSTQGAFSELFCRRVVKRRKWTVKLGILCRCICQGRGRPFTDVGRAKEWYKTWIKRLSVNSRVNLFSDAGSWQIEERHISFSKSVITCATSISTRANSECADLSLRKTFAFHKFKPIPKRCEWF